MIAQNPAYSMTSSARAGLHLESSTPIALAVLKIDHQGGLGRASRRRLRAWRLVSPFLPMRRIDLDRPPRFGINPRMVSPTARKDKGMNCSLGVNHCKPHIAIDRNI